MKLPAVTPRNLEYVKSAESDEALFELLQKKPADLISFFEAGAYDETWADIHDAFMTKALEWYTAQAYNDRLSKEDLRRVAQTVQNHSRVLQSFLPKNIIIKLNGGEIPSNTLLLSATSDYLRQVMIKECRDKNAYTLELPQIDMRQFIPINSYMNNGIAEELLTMGQDDIITQIRRSLAWNIEPYAVLAQKCLAKYLTNENVIPMILKAKEERWLHFARQCADYINNCQWGYRLEISSIERLIFEFLNFGEDTLKHFVTFLPMITDIACKGELVQHQQFGLVLKKCTRIIGLDISKTRAYSPQFVEIPKTLQELNLSECPWISKDNLKQFLSICPDLKQIDFSSDSHLNYAVWGELAKFRQIKRLSLAHCHQVQDSDLTIFLKGFGAMTDLSLRNCTKISEAGFFEISKNLQRLVHLDLSRCSITDNAIVEISSRCRNLAVLDISSCEQLTEKGILGIVRNGKALQELNIARCHAPQNVLDEIKRINPLLLLHTNF